LQFLHEYAKRLLPPVARDPHLEVSKKLLNVTAFRQEATDSIFPFTHQIEKIIESFLDDPDVLLRVAECRLLEGQYAPECRTLDGRCDRAKKLLDRVLKIKPDLALAIFWRATCNNRIGDKEAAANDFLEYLRRPGVDPEMAFWAIRELHAIAPNRTQEALRFVDLVVIEDLFYSEEVWDRQLLLDYEEGVARAKGLKVATDADSLILLRRWKEAIKLFPDLEKVEWDTDNEEWDPDKLYSWLMATWGETGILPQTACRRLLELLKEDQISFVTVAAEPLMEAFLLWGAGETEESLRKVNEATEIAQKYKGGGDWDYNYMWFSPWRHRFVSGYQFLDDCQLLRRMFQGEPLRPACLGPQPSPAPT